jgi:hypothetical protein
MLKDRLASATRLSLCPSLFRQEMGDLERLGVARPGIMDMNENRTTQM